MARLESKRNGLPGSARVPRSHRRRRLAAEALESRLLLAAGDFFRSFDNPSRALQPSSESGTAVAVDRELIAVGAPWDDGAGKSDIGQVHIYDKNSGTLLHTVQSQFPAASGRFGHALDLSANRLVVASPFADAGAIDAGIVEVFDASDAMPLVTLLNPTPAQLDYFGQAVATDGDHIVVGAYLDDTFGLDAGAAYVFDPHNGDIIHTLSPPNPGSSDYFGFSVAIDDNTIAVGARRADIAATDDGAVYLFDVETGDFLREIANPTPEGFDSFGRSVAISGDVLVVGADGDNTGAPGAGAAYLFAASSGELLHTLENPTPAFVDLFGYSVAIAGDGVVVGAIRADEGAPDSGGAYLFSASSGELLATLTDPTPGDLDVFGAAVAAGNDVVVVGAYWDDASGNDAGAAYVFENGSDRLLHSLPNPTLGSFNYFGYAVAVEANLLVVGAPFEDVDNLTDAGEVYLFDAEAGELLAVIPNPQPNRSDSFGLSVAISGSLIVVGAYRADDGAVDSGVAYVFDATTGELVSTLRNPTPGRQDYFGFSVAIANEQVLVGAYRDDSDASDTGAAYLFDAETGSLLATLSNPAPDDFDFFGYSVAMSNEALVVGAHQEDVGAFNAGAVYVFDRLDPTVFRRIDNPAPQASDQFGLSVAIWGTTLAVGAPRKDLGDLDAGGVYLFHALTGQLRHTITDTAPDFGGNFGGAISLSHNLLAVGAHRREFPRVNGGGSVDLFDATSGVLLRQLENPRPAVNDFFGWSVATGSNLTVVGTPLVDGATTDRGAVSLFFSQPNAAPFVLAGGPYLAAEGSAVAFHAVGVVDDRDPVEELSIEWDFDYDGSEFDVEATGLNPEVIFPDGFDARLIAVRVIDKLGLAAISTTTLEIEHLPPTITVDLATVDVTEANLAINSGTYAGGDDDVTVAASVGTIVDHEDGTWTWSFPTADGPDDSQVVTVSITDDDQLQSSVTFDLQVDNTPPSVMAAAGRVQVLAGTNATISGTYDDVGDDDVTLAVSAGTVVYQEGSWQWSFLSAELDDSQTVTITATDSDSATSTVSFDLVVSKIATDQTRVTIDEGNRAEQSGRYTDPAGGGFELFASAGEVSDNVDGTWSWSYTAGDGPSESQTVIVTAVYDDGTYTTEFDLVVKNSAPAADVDESTVIASEGAVATNAGSYFDPGGDPVSLTASLGAVVDNNDGTWSWSFPTADGPDDSQAITVTAQDSDGDSTSVEFTLQVTNEPPSLSVDDETVLFLVGTTATATGTVIDPGNDAVTLSASVGSVIAQDNGIWEWTFATADEQTVTITATDEDGDAASIEFELIVSNVDFASPLVMFDEGSIAHQSGRYLDPGDGELVLSTSVGAVVDNGDSTWNWTYNTVDGPEDSQTVTVSADYDGDIHTVEFELAVNNVAPTVTADPSTVNVLEADTATASGTYNDPGDDTVSVTASVGSIVDNGDGTWSWSLDDVNIDASTNVVIEATDSDGAAASTTFQLVIEPRVDADEPTVTVDEGATALNHGSYVAPAEAAVVLSASMGTVVDHGDGTWSWSYDTADGPDESATVQVFANYEGLGIFSTPIELVVNNVPPAIVVDQQQVTVAGGAVAMNTGSWTDMGDDSVSLDASVGSVVAGVDGTWSWSFTNVTGGPNDSQTVTIVATDSDGDASEVTFELVDNDVQAGPFTLDFNNDGAVDVLDTDAIVAELVTGGGNTLFDLSRDGVVDDLDLSQWLTKAAEHNGLDSAYLPGDANLNGVVDSVDLNALALNWGNDVSRWSLGDFGADGRVDAADLNALAINWQQSIVSQPESAARGDGNLTPP